MYELLKTLTSAYGASGRETPVADVIEELVRSHVDSVRRDNMGNPLGGYAKGDIF